MHITLTNYLILAYLLDQFTSILCVLYSDGIVEYRMPQGNLRNPDIDLTDATYDGLNIDDFLSGGLGQLTDGEEGQSNFRQSSHGTKGYEWIGWRSTDANPTSASPVTINFRFDDVRNFTAVRFYANNMFSKEVRVFRSAVVSFSGGKVGKVIGEGDQDPIEFDYVRDTIIEYGRSVLVPLENRVGSQVTVQLEYDARWIMISEVEFDSGRYSAGDGQGPGPTVPSQALYTREQWSFLMAVYPT